MSDFQAIADRVEIEALHGEFTDAVMMRDYDRGASLFTPDGDTACGRAYMHELARLRDGSSHLNYPIYHDRYQRTERVYEVRYHDTSPLAARRRPAGGPVNLRLVEAAGPGVVRNVTDIAQFPLARVIAVVSTVADGSSPIPDLPKDRPNSRH